MSEPNHTRRSMLRASGAAALAVVAGLAGCSGGSGQSAGGDTATEGASSTPTATDATTAAPSGGGGGGSDDGGSGASYDGWFANTDNYDGVVDATGESEVTVAVGSEANGGRYGFEPAAVRVDPGTTVVWEWTGEGGSHDVVAEDGSFESELVSEAGHTFERAFESGGATRYACTPHRAMGMRGVVEVR